MILHWSWVEPEDGALHKERIGMRSGEGSGMEIRCCAHYYRLRICSVSRWMHWSAQNRSRDVTDDWMKGSWCLILTKLGIRESNILSMQDCVWGAWDTDRYAPVCEAYCHDFDFQNMEVLRNIVRHETGPNVTWNNSILIYSDVKCF